MGDVPRDPNDTIESLGKTMQGLKDRLENLEVSNLRPVTKGVRLCQAARTKASCLVRIYRIRT